MRADAPVSYMPAAHTKSPVRPWHKTASGLPFRYAIRSPLRSKSPSVWFTPTLRPLPPTCEQVRTSAKTKPSRVSVHAKNGNGGGGCLLQTERDVQVLTDVRMGRKGAHDHPPLAYPVRRAPSTPSCSDTSILLRTRFAQDLSHLGLNRSLPHRSMCRQY
jgi:hypothetical protein